VQKQRCPETQERALLAPVQGSAGPGWPGRGEAAPEGRNRHPEARGSLGPGAALV